MIDFRELEDSESDYGLLEKWLNNKEVRKWYGFDDFIKPPSLSDIIKKYRKKVLNKKVDNPYIICIDKHDVGYIQFYESDEYFAQENVYGIDLFIGEDNYRGRGYGTKALKAITEFVFSNTNAQKITVDPDIHNERAIRCYRKAGYKIIKEIEGRYIMAAEK